MPPEFPQGNLGAAAISTPEWASHQGMGGSVQKAPEARFNHERE